VPESQRDYILKSLIEDSFLALVATTTALVEKARKLHGASPTATAALGRLLSLTGIMGSQLKGKEKISIQILSRGPLKELFAQSDSRGNVRGFVKWPHIDLPPKKTGHIDVEGALGHGGMMYVLRDFGYGEPQWGAISLKTGGVATDLAYYFALSEGIPSAVGAGVYVGEYGEVLGAGAFIIQPLPKADPHVRERLEKNIAQIKNLSVLIANGEKPENILEMIAGSFSITHLERLKIQYRCSCSRARARRTLRLLGAKDLIEMINEDHGAEVVCQFCGTKYHFSERELREILKETTKNLPKV